MARFSNHIRCLLVTLLGSLCMPLLTTSCQEGHEAGDLLGQWRLTDSQYLCLSGHVVLFRTVSRGEVYGNFQHQGDSLFMQCYTSERPMFDPSVTDTVLVEQGFGMKPFNNIRLKIVSLSSDRLELTDGNKTWSLVKW